MITRSLAKRAREEDLRDSSKRLKHAVGARGSFHTMRTRSASFAKRARDEELLGCSKRIKCADSEEPSTPALSADKEASEKVKSAARSCKRSYSQSQAAEDCGAGSKKDTPALQQVSANCFPLLDLFQPMHTSVSIFCASKNCS